MEARQIQTFQDHYRNNLPIPHAFAYKADADNDIGIYVPFVFTDGVFPWTQTADTMSTRVVIPEEQPTVPILFLSPCSPMPRSTCLGFVSPRLGRTIVKCVPKRVDSTLVPPPPAQIRDLFARRPPPTMTTMANPWIKRLGIYGRRGGSTFSW